MLIETTLVAHDDSRRERLSFCFPAEVLLADARQSYERFHLHLLFREKLWRVRPAESLVSGPANVPKQGLER